nr:MULTISPECIES: protein-disulfide reductase DsbD domain-containing protein [Gluconobacter]
MRRVLSLLALLAAGICGLGVNGASIAAESPAVVSANDTATLVTDRDSIGPDQSLRVGLRLQLKPGWHTYWINPGDAGDTPTLDVTAQGGATGKTSDIHWPMPVRLSEGGLMSYAYVGDVLLPASLTLKGSDGTTLHAHAEWLVCAEVCIPESGDFSLTLPASSGPAPEGAQAGLFQAADAKMPIPSPFKAHVSADGVLTLEGRGLSSTAVSEAWFLPEEGGLIDQVAPQPLNVGKDELSLHLKFLKTAHRDAPLKGLVVLKDEAGQESPIQISAEQTVSPTKVEDAAAAPAPASADAVPTGAGWLRVMLFAFVGGLILNLMPCVFPVLAMKALSLAKMGGVGRRVQLQSALFYTLGVTGAFAVLGLLMIGLRLAGSSAGWGFQFQSAGFVVGVCWLLFGMALNLLGVFEISAGRLGQLHPHGAGHAGDMMTGLLAVIVATPCTAPFMGVAIAGALGGPAVMGLLVFLSMGLGLAAPYVLVASVPGLASRMPKPGAWMGVLKQALAFPLLATCVWLLWVATIERGVNFVVVAGGGLVLLGFAAWIYGIGQHRAMREGGRGTVLFCRVVAVLCMVVCGAGLSRSLAEPVSATATSPVTSADNQIQSFSSEKLADLRAKGEPVFVDMTASWCITCMVNERVALDVDSVRKAFSARHVAYLKGDWTNRDAGISAYLKAHGRDGVPLYVYYPAHGSEVVLPQILTPGLVLGIIGH